jgi:DNA polymerase-3 subunit gamma/tau
MATLYRKYRPQVFEEIIGQEPIVRTLKQALETDRLAHAYLFSGPRGVGKTTLARILAKAVNCVETKNRPCGKCENCKSIAEGKFIDLIEIDAASNRGIDEIRVLRDKIQFAPSVGKKRVYIIDEVHMLTREAFNALLKTLEEPPDHTLFIFATTEIFRVPATVISRCQRFDFRLGSDEEIKQSILQVAKAEKLKIPDEIVRLIVKASGGAYRDAQSLLDQLSPYLSKGELELKEALKILNLAALEQVLELIDILRSNDANRAIEYINQLATSGIDFVDFIEMLISKLRDELIQKLKLNDDVSWEKNALERLIKAAEEAKSLPLPALPLELAAIDLTREAPKNIDVKDVEAQNLLPKASANRRDEEQPKEEKEEEKGEKDNNRDPQPAPNPKHPNTSVQHSKDFPRDQRSAIIEVVSHKNKPLGVLLAGAEWTLDEKTLCFTVEYQIYKEKIMSKVCRQMLDQAIEKILGAPLKIECQVKKKKEIEEEIEEVFGE